jgi:hypothetical protein
VNLVVAVIMIGILQIQLTWEFLVQTKTDLRQKYYVTFFSMIGAVIIFGGFFAPVVSPGNRTLLATHTILERKSG